MQSHPRIPDLDHSDRSVRLEAARAVGADLKAGRLRREVSEEVNCHVHTRYSFSPYFPAMACWKAIEARLLAVGIIDHDSVSGCEEMLDAGAALGIAATAGFELRVDFRGTRVAGRKLNNPDSEDIAYIAIHGLPRRAVAEAKAFLAPLVRARTPRTRRMLDAINAILVGAGVSPIGFEAQVAGISQAAEQGSITERHLLSAVCRHLAALSGGGSALVDLVTRALRVELPAKVKAQVVDPANPHAHYDLLGALKSGFLDRVFIQPGGDEILPVAAAVEFGNRVGAIPVYAYLGDVGESPTGDKKAERFEDAFLDTLVDELKALGFKGITSMPPRNTREQLARVQALCRAADLMEISGVDINSSRQSFNCPILIDPQFRHLVEATWALFAHERLGDRDGDLALFSPRNPLARLPLAARIAAYAEAGRRIDPWQPGAADRSLLAGR